MFGLKKIKNEERTRAKPVYHKDMRFFGASKKSELHSNMQNNSQNKPHSSIFVTVSVGNIFFNVNVKYFYFFANAFDGDNATEITQILQFHCRLIIYFSF